MRAITFDIETSGEFLGNGDFSNLEVTMVGVHDSETGEYSIVISKRNYQNLAAI